MEGEGRGWEHGFAIYRGLIGQTVKGSREGERSPMAGTDELDVKIRIASRSVAAELIDMAWLPKSLILAVATHLCSSLRCRDSWYVSHWTAVSAV